MQNKNLIPRPENELFHLLKDQEFYVRKRDLANQVNSLLTVCGSVLEDFIKITPLNIPEEVKISRPKISKGENYLGFPWSILDYPRFFNKEDIFVLRILCWWGNNFSITLHLGGNYVNQYGDAFFRGINCINKKDFYLCINDNPWHHHHSADNYCEISALKEPISVYQESAKKNNFIKVSRLVPLEKWEELPQLCRETCAMFLKLIHPSVST